MLIATESRSVTVTTNGMYTSNNAPHDQQVGSSGSQTFEISQGEFYDFKLSEN